jgi:hypothetical protein
MKKLLVFAVVLALLVPSLAMAATEFSLGGFIKLDAMWDSDNGVGKNMNGPAARNNVDGAKHGRMKFTAQGSRFNFTIKGPKLWGADVTGFLEMDFDSAEAGLGTAHAAGGAGLGVAAGGASNSYTPRLRHAMFRFNWPTSELLFGQYWSMFCEYYSESAEDGPLQMTGTPTARMAQVRFTQKFGDFTLAGLIGGPNGVGLGGTPTYNNININNGEYAETPQIQGKVSYAHDFWGKAAYYGKPTPFTVQFVGGWQRNVMRSTGGPGTGFNSAFVFGENNYVASGANIRTQNQYLNPWMFMGSLFIPVIPTQSANLAGTASILTQWWIGQGVEAFGFTGAGANQFRFNNMLAYPGVATTWNYDADLLSRFGGFVQGQYYFNNQWFANALYAVSKSFNVGRARWSQGNINALPFTAAGFTSMENAWAADNASTIQQATATLWYRPIQAIKFGLQYSYMACSYSQMQTFPAATPNTTRFGDNHRVEFVGFFYF